MEFVIAEEIFDLFPNIQIVAALSRDLDSSRADRGKIASFLRTAWQSAGEAVLAAGNAQSHPNIKAWGTAMAAAGAPRKKFPSSIEALGRRAGKGGEPVSINPVVDFYNAISLRHLVPAGGYDLDSLRQDLQLRLSRAGDTFMALDAEEAEQIAPGEVSYADGPEIITRHFVWKQSRHALLTPESRNVLFVSEILGELPPETTETIRAAFADGLAEYLGNSARVEVLDRQNNSMSL